MLRVIVKELRDILLTRRSSIENNSSETIIMNDGVPRLVLWTARVDVPSTDKDCGSDCNKRCA